MTRATHKLICRGRTKENREHLKERKWTYDPARKVWYMMLVPAHAERVKNGDADFIRGLNGHLKGCQLLLDGEVMWTSKTYEQAATSDPDQDGHGWNCDARGNRVATRKIPGSSPDDRI